MQNQKEESAYFTSKQILAFDFAEQNTSHVFYPAYSVFLFNIGSSAETGAGIKAAVVEGLLAYYPLPVPQITFLSDSVKRSDVTGNHFEWLLDENNVFKSPPPLPHASF